MNHVTGDECHLKFLAYSYFSRERQKKVGREGGAEGGGREDRRQGWPSSTGDGDGERCQWPATMAAEGLLGPEDGVCQGDLWRGKGRPYRISLRVVECHPSTVSHLTVDLSKGLCLTPSLPARPGNELIYGFSEFTCTLNELEEGMAPTDSRLRPDQRIMEYGDFEGANTEKVCSV